MRKVALLSLLAIVTLGVFGCGGPKKPSDLPELYPCKIKVIQDGQPLEGASVQLNDPEKTSRFVVGGVTDDKGVAEVKTDGKFKGAPAGKYKVLISKVFVPEIPDEVPPEDPEARKEYDKKINELNAQQADTIDVKFKRPTQTPAEIEVTSGGVEAEFDVGATVNVSVGSGGLH